MFTCVKCRPVLIYNINETQSKWISCGEISNMKNIIFSAKGPCKYKKKSKNPKKVWIQLTPSTHPSIPKKYLENLKSNYHEYLYMF